MKKKYKFMFKFMVTNVVNIQPVLFHHGLATFLQEKIIVCFAYIYSLFKTKTNVLKMDSLLFLIEKNNNNKIVG